jgi:hypothetical protein
VRSTETDRRMGLLEVFEQDKCRLFGLKVHNLLMDLGAQPLRQLFGLSGSPLLNQAGELVGMVSNILPDASGKMRFAPIDTRQLRELLTTYGKR